MNTHTSTERQEPLYCIISDSGPGTCWKIEYHGIANRFTAEAQAYTERQAHGGQWIVAEDWSTR